MHTNFYIFIIGYFAIFPFLIRRYINTPRSDGKGLMYLAIYTVISMFSVMSLLENELSFLDNNLLLGILFVFIAPVIAMIICVKFEN